MKQARNEEQLLQEAAACIVENSPWDACDLLVTGPNNALVLIGSTHSPEYAGRFRLGPGKGTAWRAFKSDEPLIITTGLQEDPDYAKHPGIPEPDYNSAFAIRLVGRDEPIGVFFLRNFGQWNPMEGEIEYLTELSSIVACGLQIFQAGYESGAMDDKLGVVSEVTRSIAASPYIEEILQLLVNLTAQHFGYKVVTVRLLDEKRQELVLRATQAQNKAYRRKEAIKLGESIAGRAIERQRSIVVEQVRDDESYIGHDLAEEQGLESMICVPLAIHGKAVGVMSCYTGEPHGFPADEIAALEALAEQAAINIEHARLQVRNTLMQEMHHRVKNNLQQVASLLRLQQRQSHYKSLDDVIEDSLSRILAIASVHELLSREDLDHVGIKTISETLIQHQQQSFLLPGKKINFSVSGVDANLNTNQATQIALIINELLLNAIEHGFNICNEGEVVIEVGLERDEILLVVSNTGDPLPDDFDPMKGQLGLQIIRSLTLGLGGEFSMETVEGRTRAELRFNRSTAE